MSRDVLIEELFRKIPPAGAAWPMADRYRWLRATESVLDLLYGDNSVIEIGPLPEREEKVGEPEQRQSDPPPPPSKQNDHARELMTEETKLPDAPATSKSTEVKTATSGRSKNRPEGIPNNINMALDAIEELGPASAQQILAWCRKKYWPDMPNTWTAVLWNFAAEGKLARAGINFVKPEEKKVQGGGAIVTVPAPKPAPSPPAPVLRSPPPTVDEGGMPFEHKGRKTMLHKKEWRLATALVRAMGKGHLDYVFLVNAATAGEKRPPVGDKPWLAEMFEILKPKLFELGLDVVHSPNFGYSVREVEPANG